LENTRMAKPSRPQLLKAKREASMAGGLESPKMFIILISSASSGIKCLRVFAFMGKASCCGNVYSLYYL
ncbi:MAG: hypothetical protein WCG64_10280, partial [Flavobacteriia bacterium]